ncbi:unnamed protein product [Dicrocoelium dendriticum]|nr:unnamed protein product [Dicrocoelium dendriticum]
MNEPSPRSVAKLSSIDNADILSFELYFLRQFLNPFRLSWTLIRLGYEPLAPIPCTSPLVLLGWGSTFYVYPNIFRYVYHSIQTYGLWKVISTGVFASACMDFTSELFHRAFRRRSIIWQSAHDNSLDADDADFLDSWGDNAADSFRVDAPFHAFQVESLMEEARPLTFFRMLVEAISLKSWEMVLTQPFFVVMVRQVAALAGGETQYTWFPIAVRSVFRESGFSGFFLGLFPRLLGELISTAAYYSACRLFRHLVFGLHRKRSNSLNVLELATYCGIRNCIYPLELTGCIMTVRHAKLALASEANSFSSWRQLCSYLTRSGQSSRGWFPFLRSHVQDKHLPLRSAP